jgi:hypothetical protein
VGELAHLHRGAGGERPEVLHADVDVLEELVDVGDVSIGLHDVGQGRARRLQRGLDVLAHLAELGAHVARADHLAGGPAGQLAGDEDRLLALDDHHVGVEHVAPDHTLAERPGLDVLTLHVVLS